MQQYFVLAKVWLWIILSFCHSTVSWRVQEVMVMKCDNWVCTLFQKQISRTFQGLRFIFLGLQISQYFKIKSSHDPYINYENFITWDKQISRTFLRTWSLFPGLSSPGKCQNKIPRLSGFSRTCTNPVTSKFLYS